MNKLLKKLKQAINKKIIAKQGGEKTSILLRNEVLRNNKVRVGMHSYGSCFDEGFNVGGEVSVGSYTSVGPNVHYFGANHPVNYVSMSPYFYQKKWGGELVRDINRYKLRVGNDCWIGYGAIITCKCHAIGNGAIIGAGSIVTQDVEPYSIVAGNPAKVIRYRFDKKTIELLEESKWYDLEPVILLKYYEYIDSPEEFAKKIIEERKNE